MSTGSTLTLHHLLPLAALVLNACLVIISLLRNPGHALNRTFASLVSAMALWNVGVFLLRRTTDPVAAYFWEVVIHAGVIALPACYYHFVLTFLESRTRRRPALVAAYALAVLFAVANLAIGRSLLAGVQSTAWGWAPVPGPLYYPFLGYFYTLLFSGLLHLHRARRQIDSSFRRNRATLIALGTLLTIAGGFVDIIRFALVDRLPDVAALYPVGIPANMVSAVLFGFAIIRYRMFDVSVVVKKGTVYGAVGVAVTAVLIAVTWILEAVLGLGETTAIWIVAPVGFLFALLLTPLGRPLEDRIERVIFSQSRGCYETLMALSTRMSAILSFQTLVDTLLQGLVRGVPLTHCAILIRDEAAAAFVLHREESITGEQARVDTLPACSPIVGWLEQADGILVLDEARLNPRIARLFGPAVDELDQLNAAVVVAVRIEARIRAILLVGEKLSGETFTADELKVLSILANQAAISMDNAWLYDRAERERHRLEVLYDLAGRLAAVSEPDETLPLIVAEATRLLHVEAAALRLLEGDELVLKACSEAATFVSRPRLKMGESLTGVVVTNGTPVAVEDLAADQRYDRDHRRGAQEQGFHGFLGVPLRTGGHVIGALNVYTKQRRRFTADEVSLLAAFADHASLMLDRHRLFAERRRAEDALRQSEKLATMGQLLAGVAHELNNPLTVISGYGGLLKSTLTGTPLQQSASQIEQAALRCTRIVRNFLALARKHPPERRHVALNRIVTEAVELLAYPFGLDNVEVTLDLAADIPELWADPHQLQQVVVNLLTNAHQAMRESRVRRLTVATRDDRANEAVVLRVVDSGPGIPAEVQAHIFEPFFTTKPVGQGTGLGLSLCLGIVEGHGGTIHVDGRPGRGAVFTVQLPVGRAPAASDQREPEGSLTVAEKSILVVDDEPAVARLVADLLRRDGHRADTAPGGGAALERLVAHAYDLVITDVRMPDIDGARLYQEVAARDPAVRPRFVFMTGDLLGPATREFLESTKAPCLPKPFDLETVRRAVALAFNGRGAPDPERSGPSENAPGARDDLPAPG
jgi:signal transduction histidine kinase/ActR/RegA family two-component response regulator